MASGPNKGPGGSSRKGRATGRATGRAVKTPPPSDRYTPPIPRDKKVSPVWFGPAILALLIIGGLLIIVNYLAHVLPGSPSNWYLLGGIAMIAAGFVAATRWR